jgi:hypothetical protein
MARQVIGCCRHNLAIQDFLTRETKGSPREGEPPLRVNWLLAVLAHSEAAFAEAA